MERTSSPTGQARKSPRHSPRSPRSAVRAVQRMTAVISEIKAEPQGTTFARGRLENVLLGRTASALSQNISPRTTSPSRKASSSNLMNLIDTDQPKSLTNHKRSTRSARSKELGKCFANVTFIKTRAEGSNAMYYSTQSALDESGELRTRPASNNISKKQSRDARGKIQSPSESISELSTPIQNAETINAQRTSLRSPSATHEHEPPGDTQNRDSDRLSEADLIFTGPRELLIQDQTRRFIASEASPDRDLLYFSRAARARSVRGEAIPQIPFSKSSGIPGISASAIRKQPPDVSRPLSSSRYEASLGRHRSISTKIQPPRISSQPRIRSASSDARAAIKPAARLAFPVPPKRHQLTPRERQALAQKRMQRETTWIGDQLDGKALNFALLYRNTTASRGSSARRSSSAQKVSASLFAGPHRLASPKVKQKQQWIPQKAYSIDSQEYTPKGHSGELRGSPHYVALSPTYAHPIVPSPVRNIGMDEITLHSPNLSIPQAQRKGGTDGELATTSAKRTVVIEPRRATTAEPSFVTLDASLEIKQKGERPTRPMYTKSGQMIVAPQTIKPPTRPARSIPPPNHNLQIYKRSPSSSSATASQPMLRHIDREIEHAVPEHLEGRRSSLETQYIAPRSSVIVPEAFDLRESSLNRSSTRLDVVNLLPYFYYKQGETITLAQLPEIMKELNYNIDALKISTIKPQFYDQSPILFQAYVQAPQRRATSSGAAYEKRRKRPKSIASPRRRI